ncbi:MULTISPECIES: 30S ribosome-binding factor RbfA [Nosocomiicoccus]|uniref:30S ribosome-binding factor RbfA n=1 Tax=Nosocomiicoccus TaxID=489909 RepID=UPI000400ACE0|nr:MULTISPECIES: 30S ribosome-binding factor RbfA [Nosocomiicoccus]
MAKRNDRVAEEIKKVVTEVIDNEVMDKEPSLKLVTVTEVEVSEELEYANVYFTTLNENKAEVEDILNKYRGLLRSAVAKNIRLRKAPEIYVKYDQSVDYGSRIEDLLNQIKNEDK